MIGIAVQSDDTDDLVVLERQESDRTRIVELSEPRDEGVIEFLDRDEETQSQILGLDPFKETPEPCIVIRAHRSHRNLVSALSRQPFSLPCCGIRPDGQARLFCALCK